MKNNHIPLMVTILFIFLVPLIGISQKKEKFIIEDQNAIQVYVEGKEKISCDTNILIIESSNYNISDLDVVATFSKIKVMDKNRIWLYVNCNVDTISLFFFLKKKGQEKELVFRREFQIVKNE